MRMTTTDVNTNEFEQAVIERSRKLPVVVDFWAEWCEPCKSLTPVLEQEIALRDGAVELAKIDVDANQELAQQYDIRGIPAVKAFKNGRIVDEFTGVRSAPGGSDFIDGLFGPPGDEVLLEALAESGEFPEIMGPLSEGDHERALEWLISEVAAADEARRTRIREVMVEIFNHLGADHPISTAYRRRLASALY